MTREEAINYLKSSGVRIRMTRAEAINYLKSSGMSDKQIETVINAFTCEDCISRTEALKHSHIEYDDDGEGHRVIYAEDIKELPSVTPKASED
jgi:SOS response regulatory protein OraA/RecX